MYNAGRRLQIVLGGVAISAAVATSVLIGIKNDEITDLDSLRSRQVTAIVEKSGGTQELEEMIRDHGFNIRYDTAGNATEATVNLGEALDAACSKDRFSGTGICTEYANIQEAFKAQAPANAKYGWVWPSTIASILTMMAAAFGVVYSRAIHRLESRASE